MMPTHAKLSCKRHWLERHSVVAETHLMPSFTLGTASGTHVQPAISVSASLAFRTNQPELRGFTPRERTMYSLTILMQTLLWPSYMNPTMSPNNATMKPTPKAFASRLSPLRNKFSVSATTPCRGLPQLLLQNSGVKSSLSPYVSTDSEADHDAAEKRKPGRSGTSEGGSPDLWSRPYQLKE